MQNRKTKKRIQYWNSLSMLVACISLSGCGNDRLPASVTGYNHMSDWSIERFTVDGASGPNLSPEEGGGGVMLCVHSKALASGNEGQDPMGL
ncbi:hypothetical protein CEK63_16065 [Xanthomonas sontii]|nr:hypothetical protein CEK63_16065 [Xanthomonas sontii]